MQQANWQGNMVRWDCGAKSISAGLCMVALNVRQAAAEHTYIPTHSDSSLLILDAECHPIWEQSRTQCSGIRRWDHGGAQQVRHAPPRYRGRR